MRQHIEQGTGARYGYPKGAAMNNVNPPILGYVRALPELADVAIDLLTGELANFAQREGFALAGVYIERKWLHSAAWTPWSNTASGVTCATWSSLLRASAHHASAEPPHAEGC